MELRDVHPDHWRRVMSNILLVDDDQSFATALGRILNELGHTSVWAVDGQDGLVKFNEGEFDLVIADLKMPRMNGIDFIREIKRRDKSAVVMVITGYADMHSAIDAMTLGAYDYIEKPVEIDKFRGALDRGLEKRRLITQLNFTRGMVWMIFISIPLWLILGIILSYLWKK